MLMRVHFTRQTQPLPEFHSAQYSDVLLYSTTSSHTMLRATEDIYEVLVFLSLLVCGPLYVFLVILHCHCITVILRSYYFNIIFII